MSYTVRVTPTAVRHIERYGQWFAKRREVPETASRWVGRVFDELTTLADHPRRCPLAAEDAHRPYEIRRLRIGYYLALFTIDEPNNTVFVIGFRHGHHRQISRELPPRSPES